MAFKRNNEIDMDQVASFLRNAVDKVKMEENPDTLNELKKVYKKNVPLFMRGYVAAYLAKLATGGRTPHARRDFRENSQDRFRNKKYTKPENPVTRSEPTAEVPVERTPRPHVQIDESLAATIFIGIGRNRRVYPRDLVGLLVGVTGIDRDRIGDIRVLANYSFVQLFAEDADKIIATLNGYDYRGRKLSVSYSRHLEEDATTVSNASSENVSLSSEDDAAYVAAEKSVSNQPFAIPSASESDSSAVLV